MNPLLETTKNLLDLVRSVIEKKIIGFLIIPGWFKFVFGLCLGWPIPPFGGMEEPGRSERIWDANDAESCLCFLLALGVVRGKEKLKGGGGGGMKRRKNEKREEGKEGEKMKKRGKNKEEG